MVHECKSHNVLACLVLGLPRRELYARILTIGFCVLVFALHRRFEIDISQFPIIARVEAALEVLPAFQQAHAMAQPDAPR